MIRINDDYVITTDELNYILCKDTHRCRKDTGKPYYKPLGYYGKLTYALEDLVERVGKDKISGDDEISLQEAVKNIEDAYKILAAEISVAIPDVGDHVDMS